MGSNLTLAVEIAEVVVVVVVVVVVRVLGRTTASLTDGEATITIWSILWVIAAAFWAWKWVEWTSEGVVCSRSWSWVCCCTRRLALR